MNDLSRVTILVQTSYAREVARVKEVKLATSL